MTTPPESILFCWSGGKDSAMALHTLLQQKQFRVAALLTTVTEGYDRIAMHGVRRELLHRQAESLQMPLHEVSIPPQCVNPIYEARMEQALRLFYDQGVRKVAFGDIFLEDLRAYREKNLARIGMTALFPIWKRDTCELIRYFHEHHFRAIAACVDFESSRSQLRRPRTGRILLPRSSAARRPLRRKRRIPHLRLRRPDFSISHSHSNG